MQMHVRHFDKQLRRVLWRKRRAVQVVVKTARLRLRKVSRVPLIRFVPVQMVFRRFHKKLAPVTTRNVDEEDQIEDQSEDESDNQSEETSSDVFPIIPTTPQPQMDSMELF